jgi:hypothetical protein
MTCDSQQIRGGLQIFGLAACLFLTSVSPANDTAATSIAPDQREFFEKEVRPLLVKRCFECHDGKVTKGGLSLASAHGWQTGGDSGPAILPGKPDDSLLIRSVRYTDEDYQMPPPKKGKLPDEEIAILTKWVAMGAPDPRTGTEVLGGMTLDEAKTWWAFQPLPELAPANPAEPAADAARIDELLQAEIERNGLTAAPAADRRTLLRRLSYNLTGLPPSAAEVETFLADASPDAFANQIERLLASPQYGVQWGRRWLDVVRYADSAGDNSDRPLPHAWRYRNWVMDAFQRDLPYDQFVRLQVAGDLIADEADPQQRAEGIVATGYLALARRFGFDSDKDMFLTYEDTIDNLGKSFLGLTLACARCHDHKYDPVSAEDYYALYGILESSRFSFAGCEKNGQPRDLVPLVPQSEIDVLTILWKETEGQETQAEAAKLQEVEAATPAAEPASMPAIPVAYAVVDREEPTNAHFQERGDPENLGPEVPRRWLTVFGGAEIPPDAGSGRRELGDWIASHPLTARVMVNRIWQWHFGHGLVRSPNDFGARGEPPTHPELLDFLTARFVQSGYSVKAMHRLILQTAAYQRSDATPAATDPNNLWLAHFSRRRLTAEELRDSVLLASGRLDLTPGTTHPFPEESTWKFSQHRPFNDVYETDKRSAYLMVQRQRRHPYLALFDGADPNASTPARETSTVPTQALYFINDPVFHAQAAAVAEKLLTLPDDETRIAEAWSVLFQRKPTADECERARNFLAAYPDEPAGKWAAKVRVLMASNEFLHVD